MYIDLQRFKRTLCLKKYFQKNPIERECTAGIYQHTELKEKSHFFPRSMISQEISTFEKMVTQDIEKIKGNNKRNNLTANEIKALRQLTEDKEIIVKPADKGGGTVILSTTYYEEEAYRILNDQTTYKKLKGDPTMEMKEKFDEFLDRGYALGVINNNEYKYMKISHPRRPVFYHLPKIHKNSTKPPGRTIVSGIDSMSSRLSEYIDLLLQPYVNKTASHLKDTLNILQDLEKTQWKEHYILVTSDVSALYSNIPHIEGITAIKNILERTNSLPPKQIDFILEGIHLILTNIYFWFNEDFYLQVKGNAMGTNFAPSFANLFMAEWEEPLIQKGGENIILYRRYIDDILLIWGGGEQSLEEFIKEMNGRNINIQLETQWSKEEVNFLHLTIYRAGYLNCEWIVVFCTGTQALHRDMQPVTVREDFPPSLFTFSSLAKEVV
uniref:Reverse transcriptase domain-containing protein n=1 Tax=Leptobrachium leishanense TaxID=445787 RepID=A0A8C5QZ70_9ANUR